MASKPLMDLFVIMGAGITADAEPSGAMRRRVEAALALSRDSSDPMFLVTGGRGKNGFSEAFVMRRMLQSSRVPSGRILEDPSSADTLSSIVACAQIARRQMGISKVIVCSDRYHILRCRWLFYLLGIRTSYRRVPSGLCANGVLRWTFYYVRESAAIVVDTAVLLLNRKRKSV